MHIELNKILFKLKFVTKEYVLLEESESLFTYINSSSSKRGSSSSSLRGSCCGVGMFSGASCGSFLQLNKQVIYKGTYI